MKNRLLLWVALLQIMILGCTLRTSWHHRQPHHISVHHRAAMRHKRVAQTRYVLLAEGIASYYTRESSGLVTASGEPLVDSFRTCARPDFRPWDRPYTAVVETKSGRRVSCRVNDRGPFEPGRVLDMSLATKDALGAGGLVHVYVYRVYP